MRVQLHLPPLDLAWNSALLRRRPVYYQPKTGWLTAIPKLQALVCDILPLEAGAGKRCSDLEAGNRTDVVPLTTSLKLAGSQSYTECRLRQTPCLRYPCVLSYLPTDLNQCNIVTTVDLYIITQAHGYNGVYVYTGPWLQPSLRIYRPMVPTESTFIQAHGCN